jgi:hypothetical protein
MRAAAEHGILGVIMYWGFFGFLFLEILARGKLRENMAFISLHSFA